MNTKDPNGYYAILGLGVDADAGAIKAAYRRRAKELHPDRNRSPNAARQFQFLNEAYATLSDPGARAEYDTMSVETSGESATTREKPEPIVCSSCGKISARPRYSIFFEVKSFIVVTTRSAVQGIFCSACAEKKVLKASALTWLLGWWGFPWGPVYSIQALANNMLGGKRPAWINARLAAHQAWYFATVGRNDLARAVALDALSLARKVPCNANTEVIDDGTNLRAQVQKLLDSLGGGGGMRFKSDWHFARRPFLVQAASAALLIGGAWYWINYAYEPQRGTKPYQSEPRSTTASRYQNEPQPATPRAPAPPISRPTSSWVRPPTAPNGQPWPNVASYLSGSPKGNFGGLSSITIDNSRNDADVLVKLVSLDGPTARPVRLFFIPAYGSFTVEKVTAGVYDVRYRDLSQGTLARLEKFSVEETKTYDGTQYSDITITIYRIRDGNLRSYNLAEDQF